MTSLITFVRAHARSVVIALIVLALSAAFLSHRPHAEPPQARAVSTARAIHADVADAASFTGTLEPSREVDLASKSGGLVTGIYVERGSRVGAGATVAVLDASQPKAAAASLSGSIAAAQATLSATDALYAQRIASAETSGAGDGSQTAGISALTDAAILARRIDESLGVLLSLRAGAPVTNTSGFPESDLAARDGQAKITARQALAEFQRADAAFQADFHARILGHDPAQEEVDTQLAEASAILAQGKSALSAAYSVLSATVSSAAVSETMIESSKQSIASLGTEAQSILSRMHDTESGVDTLRKERDAKLAEAQAQIASLEGQRQVNATLLADGTIAAPFPGVVTEKFVERGAVVAAGTPLVHLMDDTTLKLVIGVPDTDAKRYRVGTEATILLETGATAQARIAKVSPSVDAASRKVTIELAVPNASRTLIPGTYARALFETAHAAQVAVPRQAVYTQYGTSYVFVVEDGIARRRVVTLGARSETLIEIRDGVAAGETVVISGVSYLRDGDAIQTAAREPDAQ